MSVANAIVFQFIAAINTIRLMFRHILPLDVMKKEVLYRPAGVAS